MQPDHEERLIAALEKIAESFAKWAQIECELFSRRYPAEKVKRAAQVDRADDERRNQLSDRAGEEWYDETSKALPESRFEQRFKQDSASTEGAPKKKSSTR